MVLESVVEEFSRQVAALGFLPQDVIGQDPTATGLPAVEGFGDPTVEVRVDMFFPFDPYLLRLSNRWVGMRVGKGWDGGKRYDFAISLFMDVLALSGWVVQVCETDFQEMAACGI